LWSFYDRSVVIAFTDSDAYSALRKCLINAPPTDGHPCVFDPVSGANLHYCRLRHARLNIGYG